MQKYIPIILFSILLSCNNGPKKPRYTEEQIKSLQLETTKKLTPEIDSIININLNPFLKKQDFNFGSLVKEVKFIPLETTEKSLLDDIRRVIVTKSNIYIYDDFKGGSIVVFDNEGNFIKRIPNGKGPGELVRLYDVDFDNKKNELVAYTHSYFMFYTPSGEFLRQKKLPFGFYNFKTILNGYVFKTLDGQGNEHLGDFKKYTLLVTDKNFKIRFAEFPYPKINMNMETRNYLYSNNNKLLITQKFSDTIYQYYNANNKLKAEYVLDYDTKKIPKNYLQYELDKFRNTARENDYYFYLGQYLDAGSHHVFFLENWYNGFQNIIYRDKKSGILKGGTNANYDLNEIPSIAFPKSSYKDYFISYYYPLKNNSFLSTSLIISDSDKVKMKGVTENSNPVLVFFKLKEF